MSTFLHTESRAARLCRSDRFSPHLRVHTPEEVRMDSFPGGRRARRRTVHNTRAIRLGLFRPTLFRSRYYTGFWRFGDPQPLRTGRLPGQFVGPLAVNVRDWDTPCSGRSAYQTFKTKKEEHTR